MKSEIFLPVINDIIFFYFYFLLLCDLQRLVLLNLKQLLVRHMNNADGSFDNIYLFVDNLQFQSSLIYAILCIAV